MSKFKLGDPITCTLAGVTYSGYVIGVKEPASYIVELDGFDGHLAEAYYGTYTMLREPHQANCYFVSDGPLDYSLKGQLKQIRENL